MLLSRLSLSFVVILTLCGLLSSSSLAAGGGGAGGGLGAGSSGGADLNEVFEDGLQLLGDGECKQAERKFKKILKTVPRNPEANYFRGVALQCQDRHSGAIRYYKKAVKYNEDFYAAYEKLGSAYLAIGEEEDAQAQLDQLEAFRDACAEDCPPKLLQAHARLAKAMTGPGGEDAEKATGEGQQSLLFDRRADPDVAYLEAIQLINAERFSAAIEGLHALSLAIGPHPDVLNYLGYANRRLGHFEIARVHYEEALAIDPHHRGANEYLGELWLELGRVDEARRRLGVLDEACPFGCAEYDELEHRIGQRVLAAQ